jgi:uncharacterized RDD family membrane protein YckC
MSDPYPAAPPPFPGQGPGPASAHQLAGWWSRVGASIVDAVPSLIVLVVLTALFGNNDTTSSSASFQLTGLPFVIYLLFALGWLVYNVGVLQGRSGQSLGKRLLGIRLVAATTGQPVGLGLLIARQFVHILDALPCYLGFLWPLWDRENRTFADMILDTRVVKA